MIRDKLLWLCLVTVICSVDRSTGQNKKKAKDGAAMQEQVDKLTAMSYKTPVMKFNGNKYRDFVKNGPRNYSIVVMFTALAPSRGCQICAQTSSEFHTVANSHVIFNNKDQANNVFFAMVDFDEGPDVFQALKLNTAPVLRHFPAKGKPKKIDTMDIQRTGFDASAIAKWVAERTEVNIRVVHPPNYTGSIILITIFTLFSSLIYLKPGCINFIYNKTLWSLVLLLFVFTMTSGQMWNHIRGAPLMSRAQGGGVAYIARSSQSQGVIETYMVMGMYGLIVMGVIILTESAEGKGGAEKRKIFAIIGLVITMFFFSLILSVFRSKAGDYPYSLFFK